MSEKKIRTLAAAYASEINLWDDPFEAPSVPDRAVLDDFLENPDSVEKDLAAQIRSDLNCKRALDRVKFEKYNVFKGKDLLSEEDFHKQLESMGAPAAKLVLNEPDSKTYFPRKGGIFYTKGRLPRFEDGKISYIYTFKPCTVLILGELPGGLWGDRVFKCAVVTPECNGKAVEGQDMKLGNGWILHKWLPSLVSFYQIDPAGKAGEVADVDKIAEIVENYPVSDLNNMHYGIEEKRLAVKAEYLTVMYDTNFAVHNMKETAKKSVWNSVFRKMGKFLAECVEQFPKPELPTETLFAASDENVSTLLAVNTVGGEHRIVNAVLTDPIFLGKHCVEENLPEWSFESAHIIPEGCVFLLRDKRGENIGFGRIYNATGHKVAKLMEYYPEKLEDDITNADQVVLEVYTTW